MSIHRQSIFSTYGRKSKLSKLSETDLKKLFLMVENGLPFSTAGEFYGVSKQAIYSYIRKGEVYINAEPHERNPYHEQYAFFSLHIKRARARYFYKLIKSINNTSVSNESWKRDFRILSRRDQSRWGPAKHQIEHESRAVPDNRFL